MVSEMHCKLYFEGEKKILTSQRTFDFIVGGVNFHACLSNPSNLFLIPYNLKWVIP